MDNRCSICGREYDTFAFKGGYICEGCLQYLKDFKEPDTRVRKVR